MNPAARRNCLLSSALLLSPLAAAGAPAPSTLPTVQVQAARVPGVDPFALPGSLDTVWIDPDRAGPGVQLSEALGGVPGLLARDRQNFAQDTQLSIRGFGARSTFGVRGVRVLIDGVPATMPDGQGQLSHASLLGAERVEVLRGPFSALYGNSSGGVLQVWSAQGQAGDPWRLRVNAGADATVSVGAQLRGAGRVIDYNIAANHFRTDGWRDHSRARRESLNARFGTELGGGHLELLLNALQAPDAQDPLGLTRAQVAADPRQATAVAAQYNTRKSVRQQQAGLRWTRETGAQRWQLMGYAGQRTVTQFLPIPPAPQANPLHAGGVIDLDGGYGGLDARWGWNGDVAGRPLDLVVGINADRQRQHRTGYENVVGSLLGVRGRLRRDQIDVVQNLDQFAQLWWQWSPRWSLLAGVRHSAVRFESDDRYIVGRNPDDSGHRRYQATTPVAGVSFEASPQWRLHAAVGRGFETPTFNELGYRADGQAGLALDLAAARSRNLEVGSKWHAQDGTQLDISLFRADTDDELAVASNAGGRSTYRNIGRTRRQGVELQYRQPLAEQLELELAWTWLQAQVRSPYLTSNSVVAAGSRLPGVPRQQAFARLQWSPGDWQWALEASASSDTVVNDVATERAPGFALLHLEAGRRWTLPGGELRAFARLENVLDQAYIGSVIVNDGNSRFYEPGPGRRANVGLQWSWR
ncbi:TonB-dependent receptor [Stenotrophomonas maltophilia]|uniref:TonB-dependent receptor family protein n=1 Tax=Stenotrophomonas TaxID=40323 RepID=UPI00131315CE|nr:MULTISPECIES: TonB-dependent receptor [Stenotrophomonas]ELC7321307.1 TonB-dependent receptor [Stenotrophomonas maltophilia]MBA0276771.1 TonB-dependent receptor [Stenotrophomonas maltophilia]MBA0412248.1 TonB-dependent receptor [Stenotrophomonas maltophilia]MBA0498411.1 TonB-dependent receptor [Stenotrophomonas maltophilia]MBA0503350.1 TonB-dependent receptor [Stenotrophomonas maltophilia]